jgi:hypothetical protein
VSTYPESEHLRSLVIIFEGRRTMAGALSYRQSVKKVVQIVGTVGEASKRDVDSWSCVFVARSS